MRSQEYSSITIRKLPIALKQALRLQAARHGHSMEEEARLVLQQAVLPATHEMDNAYEWLMAARKGLELNDDFEIPPRNDLPPKPIAFEE